jgi:membrane associated rhomboid family serine protease
MNGTAIVPAAFALLTAMFMFGGRTRRSFDNASHIAAALLVLFFLICSLGWIVVTSMIGIG